MMKTAFSPMAMAAAALTGCDYPLRCDSAIEHPFDPEKARTFGRKSTERTASTKKEVPANQRLFLRGVAQGLVAKRKKVEAGQGNHQFIHPGTLTKRSPIPDLPKHIEKHEGGFCLKCECGEYSNASPDNYSEWVARHAASCAHLSLPHQTN